MESDELFSIASSEVEQVGYTAGAEVRTWLFVSGNGLDRLISKPSSISRPAHDDMGLGDFIW
jgi:hypothetical protein